MSNKFSNKTQVNLRPKVCKSPPPPPHPEPPPPPPTTVDVCSCAIKLTMSVTFFAANCAGLDGMIVQILYAGLTAGVYKWEGTFTPSWGFCNYPLKFHLAMQEPISCKFVMWITDGGGTIIWGTNDFGLGNGIPCPFVSVDDVNVNRQIPFCLESIMPPLCGGQMRATVEV